MGYEQKVMIHINESQTITELSDLLQPYKAEVFLKKVVEGSVREVNLKSFLGLITIRLQNGDDVLVRTEGEDAKEALDKVIGYLQRD